MMFNRMRVLSTDTDTRLLQALNILVDLYQTGTIESWIIKHGFGLNDGQTRIRNACSEIRKQVGSDFNSIVSIEREPQRFKKALFEVCTHELAHTLVDLLPMPYIAPADMRLLDLYLQDGSPMQAFTKTHGRESHAALCRAVRSLSEYREDLWNLVMKKGSKDVLESHNPIISEIFYAI